jgi:hypothetical protein
MESTWSPQGLVGECQVQQMAIASLHPRFYGESHCHHHLDGPRLGHGALAEHDDDVECCCLVDLTKDAHLKDVRVVVVNASSRHRGKGGGSESGNKHRWTFVPEQKCALNALALSSDPRKLLDHKFCCP